MFCRKNKIFISLLLSTFFASGTLFLSSCAMQSNNSNVNNNGNVGESQKPIFPPPTKPDDIEQTLPSLKFEKRVGNGQFRTKYFTSSYISNRYERKPAEIYSNDELKEMLGEDKFTIHDFPYPNNTNANNFNKERYKRIIDMYSSSHSINDSEKMPMMFPLMIDSLLENNKLKKHIIADYQYGYDNRVTDDTKAVEKVFNIDINEQGYISTGLFLPPGEIIEVSIDNLDDSEIAKNDDGYYFRLSLGKNENSNVDYEALSNNSSYPKLWSYRMPVLRASKTIDKKVFRFGTPFGGIVHLYNFTKVSENTKKNIKLTIKGAVEAVNYIHGKTTEQEWNDQINRYKNKNDQNKITAPIFDISTDNIKFYGTTKELELEKYDLKDSTSQKSYPQKIMDWWDYNAISSFHITKEFNKPKNAILMTYTNFVPIGLAVAWPNEDYCILPMNIAKDILDYNKLIDSQDVWINLHEFNHHNQSNGIWAFDEWIESSNNVLSLLSLLENSNFYSDRSDLKEENNINDGHNFKILSRNQIKQTVNLGEKWNNNLTSRNGTDTDFALVFSQFGPDMFRKYVKSFFDEKYQTDYLGQKFKIPNELSTSTSQKVNLSIIYRLSIITGFDWSEYSLFTKLLTENEKNLVQNKLKEKYPKIKKMIPVGSFYANKIKYGEDKQEWVKSSTPFYLKNTNVDYTFKKDLLVNTPIKNNNEKFGEIIDFKIDEYPKFGSLTTYNSDYKYKMNANNDISINNLDSFSYSFSVKDNNDNLNKVKFKVDIQLSKYAGFELEKNENRLEQNYVAPYSTKLGINGDWEKGTNIGKFNKETLKSKNKNSQLGFNFVGDSFDVYGFAGNEYGEYSVYVDGKLIQNTRNFIDKNSKDIQKLSTHKLNNGGVHNVIIKPKDNNPIEISHIKFNGELIDIKIK